MEVDKMIDFILGFIKFTILVSFPCVLLGNLHFLDSGKAIDWEFAFWAIVAVVFCFIAIWKARQRFIPQSVFLLVELTLSVGGLIIMAGFFPQI